MNVIIPSGVPADELTVAVNVTDCPMTEGLTEELKLVDVDA
jgi:hypothetical protein